MNPRRMAYLVCVQAALLVGSGCNRKDANSGAQADGKAPAAPPNILLISVDTLRPDHLKCYGYSRATSPRIDQLAHDGTLFETAISSSSWTLPAHAALFTGLVDSAHGAVDLDRVIKPGAPTMAERLRSLGYATAGFYSAASMHPTFGLGRGFDEYLDCTSYTELTAKLIEAGQPPQSPDVLRASHSDVANPRTTEAARQWLRAHAAQRFFMFVHLWDVHADYIPPPPYDTLFDPNYSGPVTGRNFATDSAINPRMPQRDREHLVALYDGEIAWTDFHVGLILDEMERLGLRDKTLVVLFSDHGEEHFEHGGKGHRETLFDEVIRIALIMRYPGHVPAARRVREQVRMIDVLPTIFDVAGLPAPSRVMGQTLVPLWSGRPLGQNLAAFSELLVDKRELRAYRRSDQKLIEDELAHMVWAYDLQRDPGEQAAVRDPNHPLARHMRSEAADVLQQLAEWQAQQPTSRPTTAPQMPDDVRKALESLGYIRGQDAETHNTP